MTSKFFRKDSFALKIAKFIFKKFRVFIRNIYLGGDGLGLDDYLISLGETEYGWSRCRLKVQI